MVARGHYNFGRGFFVFSLLSGCNNHHNGNSWPFVESRTSLHRHSHSHSHGHGSKEYWNDASDYSTRRRKNGRQQQHPPPNQRKRCLQHGESHYDRWERSRNDILILYSLRGGAADETTKSIIPLGTKTTFLNDEDVDQLVDELIASVNDGGGRGDDHRLKRSRSMGDVVEPANKEGRNNWDGVAILLDIDDEQGIKEEYAGAKLNVDSAAATVRSYAQPQSPNNNYHHHHLSFVSSSPRSNATIFPPSTPTNAYYRFIVRRGPKGHILACFTVVAVQWVYTFIPSLYQLVSFALLKFYIYNPRVLYERERRRRSMSRYSATNNNDKGGLKHKFNIFGNKSKQEQQQQAMLQKHGDEEAANKLKQLYRTIISSGSGSNMLSEVKYRYLSVAFRRKHGLGKEYRIEKPRAFLGEIVGTRTGDESLEEGFDIVEDFILPDDKLKERDGIERHGTSSTIGSDKPRREQRQRSKKMQPLQGKRKLVTDWVVDAFSTKSRGKVNHNVQLSSLWNEVDRDAIVEAAWESRAVDPSVAVHLGRRNGAESHDSENSRSSGFGGALDDASGAISSGGYSASKMFQSVITRVGSNGRVFGAYPNDAYPIEQCANERGVVELARKYGYGDWRPASDEREESGDDNEVGDDIWGGNLD